MKYLVIAKLAPGVDNARSSFAAFQKVGLPPGTESSWAAADGKTFITITESDGPPDMANTMTFAPYLEDSQVIPLVPLDDAWIKAVEAAQANWT
jgi:hypothetical protein